ncbi:hypothetical protein DXG01_001990 [Tephrocybe rancida]|nr:hypothetical protein DXG01_001990 [Tephrocybe rancida]
MDDLPITADTYASVVDLEADSHIAQISTLLVNILNDAEKYAKLLNFRGQAAQNLIDLLQKVLTDVKFLDDPAITSQFRATLRLALVRLCQESELYPLCFSIEDVHGKDVYPVAGGYSGDVYKALHNGQPVCLKVLRLFQYRNQSLLRKAFWKEAVVWGQLFHPNVLPFYGIHHLADHDKSLCLVSPWMPNGNIRDFLDGKPHADRTLLISDVAAGLKYLHESAIVHGDLTPSNLLVTGSERDAGLEGHALSSAQSTRPSLEAPELIDPDLESNRKTLPSDVIVGVRPFRESKPMSVYLKILRGEHPKRPSETVYLERGLNDAVWTLLERCWSHLPERRPTAAEIAQQLPCPKAEQLEEWPRRPSFDISSGQVDATITNVFPHLRLL